MPRRVAHLCRLLLNASMRPETLAARQTRSLVALVRHAAERVPFYRQLYAAQGIDIATFNGVGDLAALPIVDKHVLRSAGADALSADAPAKRVMITTSGSSGDPFTFPIDRGYDLWRKAQFIRPYLNSGRRLGDKVLRLCARPSSRPKWFSRLGVLRERQIDAGTAPARVAEAWQEYAPDVLMGYPSSLRSLAYHCLELSRPLSPAPRLVFTDSELLTPDTRAVIEQAFGTGPIDVYGTFETDNIAWQCAARADYHIATDCVVLEVVKDGKPVPPGEDGEIVVTVLHNRTFPFIRYNLRDMGRLGTQPCACGLPFPMLAGIQGRANDLIVLADGRRRTATDLTARIGRSDALIHQYQLRQLAIGRFELLVVSSSQFGDVERESLAQIVRSALGDAHVEVRVVEAIAPERSGKRRAFISEVRLDADDP